MPHCKKDVFYIHRQKIMMPYSKDDFIVITYIFFNEIGQSKIEILFIHSQKEEKTGAKRDYREIL
jgi:hypothetical protein